MSLPIYVKWELQNGEEGRLREGGKTYTLDVLFDAKKLKWESFVNTDSVKDENGNPIESDSVEGAKRIAELHVERLLIEDGIFHKDGYPLVDNYGNPKKK